MLSDYKLPKIYLNKVNNLYPYKYIHIINFMQIQN